jgi:hypothetical protein
MRYVTEGEKKVDAGVSQGLLMIGMSGVWNGQKDKRLIPDWDLLPLTGEDFSIAPDSDIETNTSVQGAVERQARLLRERGANVFVTLLPPAPDGSKQGLDDFFANGGTVEQLELLTTPYDATVVERIRLSRDERLRANVGYLLSRLARGGLRSYQRSRHRQRATPSSTSPPMGSWRYSRLRTRRSRAGIGYWCRIGSVAQLFAVWRRERSEGPRQKRRSQGAKGCAIRPPTACVGRPRPDPDAWCDAWMA